MFSLAYNNIFNRHSCKYYAVGLVFVLVIIAFCVGLNTQPSYALDVENQLKDSIENQLSNLNLTDIEQFIAGLKLTGEELFSGSFLDNIKNVINGTTSFDYVDFFSYVIRVVFDDILEYIPLLSIIVVVCIICSFVGHLSPDGQGDKINKVIYFACFSLVAVMVFSAFKGLLENTTVALNSIKTQMQLVFPILLTLITSIGSIVTVSTFQPAVVLLTSTVSSLITSLLVPLFLFSFVFNIVGNLSSNVKLEKCSKFIFSLFKWILGAVVAVFMTVLSLQGIMASVTDSISIKTTKFALKSYVPIVGGFVSDGLGLLVASGVLIKNAVGLTGLLVLGSTIIVPVVEIAIFSLGLKLVSAVVEPLSNNNMANFLYNSSKCLNMLVACVVCMGFMYILTVGLMMCTSNII